MDSLIEIAYNVVLYAFLLWVLQFALQLSDLFASLLDLRGAGDIRTTRRGSRRRVTEYFWSIPVLFTLVLGFALGIDYAGRLLFEESRTRDGLIVVSVLLFIAFGAGIGILFALSRVDTASYATLRENLSADAGLRLSRTQIDAFRAQLEHIDGKQRRIRLGVHDRAGLPRTRAQLSDLADRFRAVQPSSLEALSSIRWSFAWAYLWRGNLLRVAGPILALVALIIAIVAAVLDPESAGWFAPLGLGAAFVVSSLTALQSARASLASKAVWHAIYLKQRTEAEDLLIELEKASRKGVVGLGDRVTRALQILREQQE